MNNIQLIRRLYTDVGAKHKFEYLGAFVCMAFSAGATALSAWLMRDVVNQIFVAKEFAFLGLITAAIIVVFVIKGLGAYGQLVILSRVANAIVADIQRRIFDHMLRSSVSFFSERHSSDFIARQSFITRSAGDLLNLLITAFSRDVLTLIGLLTVMVIQDPTMSLLAFATMPFAILGVKRLSKRAQQVVTTEFSAFSQIMESIQETSQGIRVVKAYGLEDFLRHRQGKAISNIERASNKLARIGARSTPLMETIGGFAVAFVVLYGGWRVITLGHTPGEFFSFITALLLAYEPAKRLARMKVNLTASLVGVSMLYEFLDTPAGEQERGDEPDLVVSKGHIEFQDVVFGYRLDEPLFKDFNLTMEGGKMTALIGPSGAGKTTVMSLLLRYWDVQGGAIRIDGQDVRDVSRRSLRRAIAYVGQDAFLFKGTIRDNIAMGRPEASFEDVVAAAKAAHAHDFIMGFQEGYETQCGENGVQLSGGQRQRIAIARAFLKDARILLLDEATSALDTASERAVQNALDTLCAGRTMLVIAHRLSTVLNAHKICVIEKGTLVEEGEHFQLLEKPGPYARMIALQMRNAA